jgi:ubiquinone biosynthesis protein
LESHPFRFIRSLGRSREIATVLLNHGFGDLVERLHLRRYLQWGKRVLFRRQLEPEQHYTRGQRVRMALESLGATFIKFGQVISTRPDLVPADIVDELVKLREHVRPFPSETAVKILQDELGAGIDELFAEFEIEPVAAGSLAQVHRARHHDGTVLAVKIRRPNVVRDIERDLALMLELAILIERHIPEAEIFDPVGLVNQFSRTIQRELNFRREARTIDEFARLFRNDATLCVPAVYDELTTEAVVTMEFIDGYRVDHLDKLKEAGISSGDVAANGARIYMKQAFELGLFHGDPHPGNIRIMPDGSICLLDYGMVGMLDDEIREWLVDLFLAIGHKNVANAVELMQRFARPHHTVDAPLLRADVRDFVENYYGLSLERMNVGNMLTDFVTILSNHGIRCPADLMLLIRALVTLEGVGRQLDPTFNMAAHLAPVVEKVVRERYNPGRLANRLVDESKTLLKMAHDVPLFLGKSLEKLSEDDLRVQLEHRGLDHLITELDRSSNRIVIGLVMSSLIVASALIIRTGVHTLWLSVPIFILSSLLGIWLIYGVFRSGRL